MATIRALTATWLCAIAAITALAAEPDERYLIRFAAGAETPVRAAIQSNGGRLQRALPVRRLLSATLPPAAVRALRARGDVDLIELDPKRYPLAQSTPYGIPLVQAFDPVDGTGLAEVAGTRKVCIMDTGYDLTHPDLPSDDVTGDDDCGPGCGSSGNWFEDGHGHGTHVAGTVLALDNAEGVVGVNPNGWLALHVVKVFDDQGGWAYGSDIIAAIDQCAAAGADVVNMSLGGSGASVAEQAAFDAAYADGDGMLFVAAAGNAGREVLSYPASYDAVMSVAAVDAQAAVAGFSQFNHQVEVAAPGVAVLSTLPGSSYAAWNGTSMSAPHVTGVAALVWSHFEACTAGQIRSALVASARDLGGPGRDSSYGHGLVQALAARDALAAAPCAVAAPADDGYISPQLNRNVAEPIPAADYADEYHYSVTVPPGATDLRIRIYDSQPGSAGGSADADLYVVEPGDAGRWPAADVWDCRPWINGSAEACVYDVPAAGAWRIMVRAYTSFADVSVYAGYQTVGDPAIAYQLPDADLPVAGSVVRSYAELRHNDGALQTITEVSSGGKPSQRTSLAEHQWRIPGVSSGSSVTLQLVAAGSDTGEGDAFAFDYAVDGGAWQPLCVAAPECTLRIGGALQRYQVPLPSSTSGTVLVRARDTDRTPRNLANNVLYIDQLNIVTVDPSAAPPPPPPTPPLQLSASGEKRKGRIFVTLEWTTPSTATVYRSIDGADATQIATGIASGTYLDDTGLRGSPTLEYHVCDDTNCSNPVTLTF